MAHQYHHFPSEKDFLHFRKVNQAHWEAFQQNKLTKRTSFITQIHQLF